MGTTQRTDADLSSYAQTGLALYENMKAVKIILLTTIKNMYFYTCMGANQHLDADRMRKKNMSRQL